MSEQFIDISEPEAAEINEPLKTHYLGRAALDLPHSLELGYLSVKFKAPGRSGFKRAEATEEEPASGGQSAPEDLENCPLITFHESSGGPETEDRVADPADILKSSTEIKSLLGQATALGEEELSETFGRPSKLIIHLTRSTILDDIRSGLDLPPAPDKLEIDLVLKEDWGLLEFSYELELRPDEPREIAILKEDAMHDLIGWVQAFLPRYHWTGLNEKPPEKALATALGFIESPEEPAPDDPEVGGDRASARSTDRSITEATLDHCSAWNADFYGNFSLILERPGSTLDFLTFTARGLPRPLLHSPAGGRKVGGHPGEESKNFTRLGEIAAEARQKKKAGGSPKPGPDDAPAELTDRPSSSGETAVYLEWEDYSQYRPDNFKPLYDAALYASAAKEAPGELAYYLGLWEVMLNSIRLPGE